MGFIKQILPQIVKQRLRKKKILQLIKENPQVVPTANYLEQNLSYAEPNNFIVLDTETNGLDINTASLLSIGYIKIENTKILLNEAKEHYINNKALNKHDAITIHGIRNTDLRQKGIELSEALLQLITDLKDAVIVAHHARFDANMLHKAFQNKLGIPLLNPILDTAILARQLDRKGLELPPLKSEQYQLDTLCEIYKVEQEARHTALGDAYATALLFLKLNYKLQARKVRLADHFFWIDDFYL